LLAVLAILQMRSGCAGGQPSGSDTIGRQH
jgi:hypothetical protein